MVANACDYISVTVKVGSETFTRSQASITNHLLAIDAYETIVVTISYAYDGEKLMVTLL